MLGNQTDRAETTAGMGSPIDLATFLQRAQSRFGDRYDYSAMVYKSFKTPVHIRCREHPVRDIVITPEKHLQTSGGCKFCLRASRVRLLERQFSIDDAPPRDLPPAKAPEPERISSNPLSLRTSH